MSSNTSSNIQTCIDLKNLTIGYNKPLISDIHLEIRLGEYWGIIGPNGSGKTTLFKTILGLIKPMLGSLKVSISNSQDVIAYVPQQAALNPNLPVSVRELILMPKQSLWPWVKIDREILKRLDFFANKLGIGRLLDNQISELSGGEKQKSLICRALITESPVLLLDEPTNGMDISSEKEILSIIKKLNKNDGYTIVFVTHFLSNLLNEAQKFAIFDNGKINKICLSELVDGNYLTDLYRRQVSVDYVKNNYSLRIGDKLR